MSSKRTVEDIWGDLSEYELIESPSPPKRIKKASFADIARDLQDARRKYNNAYDGLVKEAMDLFTEKEIIIYTVIKKTKGRTRTLEQVIGRYTDNDLAQACRESSLFALNEREKKSTSFIVKKSMPGEFPFHRASSGLSIVSNEMKTFFQEARDHASATLNTL